MRAKPWVHTKRNNSLVTKLIQGKDAPTNHGQTIIFVSHQGQDKFRIPLEKYDLEFWPCVLQIMLFRPRADDMTESSIQVIDWASYKPYLGHSGE